MSSALPTDALALLKAAEHLQLDMTELEARSGINLALLKQRSWISARSTRRLFMSIGLQLGSSDYPVRIGQAFSPDTLGPLGILFVLASNLGEAFDYLEKYYHLQDKNLSPVVYSRGGQTIIQIKCHQSVPYYLKTVMSASLAVRIIALIRWIMGSQFQPEKLCLQRHIAISGLDKHLKCQCHYGCAMDAIVLPHDIITMPLQQGNEIVTDKVRTTLLSHLRSCTELVNPLRKLLLEHLQESDYSLEEAACQLGTTSRTLQRRLKEMDTSFSKQLGSVRMEKALELLEDTDMSISEIAYEVGYSTESAFARGLLARYSITPAQYRCSVRKTDA